MNANIHILYQFKSGPWGGGNQFLKALRQALIKQNCYVEMAEDADVILFNSHHFGEDLENLRFLIDLKKSREDLRLIHRLDGPVSLIRGGSKLVDKLIFDVNSKLADGTVFQTDWSRKKSAEIGLETKHVSATIINAPDEKLFYPNQKQNKNKKIKVINSAWAANDRKGLDILRYLDSQLDFSRFEMTFVGNVETQFQNITILPPQDSATLAKTLRAHDIFIAPSINDPCSNALCEALHCGLPALVRNSGGHPELMGNGGLTFNNENDVLEKLEQLALSHDKYSNQINMLTIHDIAEQYISFAEKLIAQDKHFEDINIDAVRRKTKRYAFNNRIRNAFISRINPNGWFYKRNRLRPF